MRVAINGVIPGAFELTVKIREVFPMIDKLDDTGRVVMEAEEWEEEIYNGRNLRKITPAPPSGFRGSPSGDLPLKRRCGACEKGKVSPLFNNKMIRDCSCCMGKGWHWNEKPIKPIEGAYKRFKAFLQKLIQSRKW